MEKHLVWLMTLCICCAWFCNCFSLESRRSRPGFQLHDEVASGFDFRTKTKVVAPGTLNRRSFVALISIMIPTVATAREEQSRSVSVGGGLDLLSGAPLTDKDVVYPLSMEGLWVCNRIVTQVEGDAFQAGSAWRSLGGGSGNLQPNKIESFQTRFVRSPMIGEMGVVNDRGFELTNRAGTSSTNIVWNVENPDILDYERTKLVVVQRSVELPTDKGFGFNELLRIDDGLVTRAVQVKRRYRRAYDANGNRVVEGLEIMKTFRVLDGVAGTEFPTSTVKSQIRLVRP